MKNGNKLQLKTVCFLLLTVLVSSLCAYQDWQYTYDGTAGDTIALWTFNEDTIWMGSSEEVLSGRSRMAIKEGNASFSSGGKFGWGFHNVGGDYNGDDYCYVTTGYEMGASVFPDSDDPNLTVECWVKLDSTSQDRQYFVDKGYLDDDGYQLAVMKSGDMADSEYRLFFQVGDGENRGYVSKDINWQTDRFYHIAGTWNSETDTLKLYRDGELLSSRQEPGLVIENSGYTVYFGSRAGAGHHYALDGVLDDVRISSKAYDFQPLSPEYCGDAGTYYYPGDISGYQGECDCYVDYYDFAKMSQNWLVDNEIEGVNDPCALAFFAEGPETPAGLDPNELYPQGSQFMFSLYSVVSPELEQSKANGFTAIGPYYGTNDQNDVDRARNNDVKTFFMLNTDWEKDTSLPSDSEIQNNMQTQVNDYKDDTEISVWYFPVEELRYWRNDDMHYLQVASDAIRNADPYDRPIMMYEAGSRDADGLKQTLPYLDFCTQGSYVNTYGHKDERIWLKQNVEQQVNAVAGFNDKTVVTTLWMEQDPCDPSEDVLIDDWTRHDAYLSLITGSQGITVWSGWNKRDGFERTFDLYHDGYASVAYELNKDPGFGKVFLFGQTEDDISIDITSGPETLTLEDGSYTAPSVNYLDTRYGDNRYLFMVNSANVSVSVSVSGLPQMDVNVEEVLSSQSFTTTTGGFSASFNPLEVKAYRFSPAEPLERFCGDTQVESPVGDIYGRDNQQDCKVDFIDLAYMSEFWLSCSNPEDSNCVW